MTAPVQGNIRRRRPEVSRITYRQVNKTLIELGFKKNIEEDRVLYQKRVKPGIILTLPIGRGKWNTDFPSHALTYLIKQVVTDHQIVSYDNLMSLLRKRRKPGQLAKLSPYKLRERKLAIRRAVHLEYG